MCFSVDGASRELLRNLFLGWMLNQAFNFVFEVLEDTAWQCDLETDFSFRRHGFESEFCVYVCVCECVCVCMGGVERGGRR